MKFIKLYERIDYKDYKIGDYVSVPKSELGNGVFNCLQIVGIGKSNGLIVEYIINRNGKDFLDKNEIFNLNITKLNTKYSYFDRGIIEEYELRKSMTKYNL